MNLILAFPDADAECYQSDETAWHTFYQGNIQTCNPRGTVETRSAASEQNNSCVVLYAEFSTKSAGFSKNPKITACKLSIQWGCKMFSKYAKILT